jgi:hypothetical protein
VLDPVEAVLEPIEAMVDGAEALGVPPGGRLRTLTIRLISATSPRGDVAEWSKAAVLKTAVGQPTRGSNPFVSAKKVTHRFGDRAPKWCSHHLEPKVSKRA